MVAMGTSLDMEVLAEGIEDQGQLQDLRALHCDLGQGYLFSKPVPGRRPKRLHGDRCPLSPLPLIDGSAPEMHSFELNGSSFRFRSIDDVEMREFVVDASALAASSSGSCLPKGAIGIFRLDM